MSCCMLQRKNPLVLDFGTCWVLAFFGGNTAFDLFGAQPSNEETVRPGDL